MSSFTIYYDNNISFNDLKKNGEHFFNINFHENSPVNVNAINYQKEFSVSLRSNNLKIFLPNEKKEENMDFIEKQLKSFINKSFENQIIVVSSENINFDPLFYNNFKRTKIISKTEGVVLNDF